MKFLAILLSVFSIMACVTTKNDLKTTESGIVPACSQVVSDFYANISKKKQIMADPVLNNRSTVFIAAHDETLTKIDVLCLLTTQIPKAMSGCTKIGDIIGKCSIIDGKLYMWYGTGTMDTNTTSQLKS